MANASHPYLNRTVVMLAVAGLAGLLAAWAARQHIQGKVEQLEAQARTPTVQRIVAAHDLPAGQRLQPDHLVIREFPSALVPSDSLAPERYTELAGARLRAPVRAGDLILPVHAAVSDHTAFSSRLTKGRRAITMPVDAISSVSGLLEPGDLIDLYVSFEYQRRRITAPLLQGVLVLATGTSTTPGPDHEPYATVTLDAAPEDAVKLVAARESGAITAVLRPGDDSAATQRAVRGDLASLLGVARPPPNNANKVAVIYGNQSPRTVPKLGATPATGASQRSGLFDLPELPDLVSAWMLTASQMTHDQRSGVPGIWAESQHIAETLDAVPSP